MLYISEEHINEYLSIIFKKYNKDIDAVVAREQFTALVHLLETVYRHMKRNNWPDISHISFPIEPLCFPPLNGHSTPESQPNQKNDKSNPLPTKSDILPMS
jgi:hypothetical protein